MTPHDLIQYPTVAVPCIQDRYIRTEDMLREASFIMAAASYLADDQKGMEDVSEHALRLCGEIYERDTMFACAIINVLFEKHRAMLIPLCRVARRLRKDGKVGEFLSFLKRNLLQDTDSEGRKNADRFLIACERKSGEWLTLTHDEIEKRIRRWGWKA